MDEMSALVGGELTYQSQLFLFKKNKKQGRDLEHI